MKLRSKVIIGLIIFIAVVVVAYFIGYFYINIGRDGGISVLAYHHFMSEEDKEKYEKDNYWVISNEKFEEQIKYLKEKGYNSITIEEVICYVKNECDVPDKSYIITIDDGNVSSYYNALPILEKYDVDSVNFVITSRSGELTDKFEPQNYRYVGMDVIKDINDNHKSMILGSHSHGLHDLINDMNPIYVKTEEEMLDDVKKSKEILFNTNVYAYPFGQKTEKYEKVIKEAGYEAAFTFKDNRKAKRNEDLFSIPRIEIRGDMSLYDFKYKVNGKISLVEYTKKIIKKILNMD